MNPLEQNIDPIHAQYVKSEKLKIRACGCTFTLLIMSTCALITLAAQSQDSLTVADLPLVATSLALGYIFAYAVRYLNGDFDRPDLN